MALIKNEYSSALTSIQAEKLSLQRYLADAPAAQVSAQGESMLS